MTTAPRISRWVVDAQVLQTGARHRGMGLYALELLSALDTDGRVEVDVLLSAAFDDTEARRALARRAVRSRVHTLDLRADTPGDTAALTHNQAVLDSFLQRGGKPASSTGFLLLSAMQGTVRPALPRRPGIARWALVYDLIPLLFHDSYLRVPELRHEYETRLTELLQADGYLTISRTVSNDLASQLGIDPDRIVTIDGAPIPADGDPHPLPDPGAPFILMPTGNDRRKNNRRGVAAFEQFNAAHDSRYLLLVTSRFEPDEIAVLTSVSSAVRFTGSISGAQLGDLYTRADAVLFPPTYEGLGLPVLEALATRTPVACSDIPVFREISTEALAFFDPESVSQIARALTRVVASGPPPVEIVAPVMEHYRWSSVAHRLIDGTYSDPLPPARRPITVVGPELGAETRAASVLAATHAELSRVAAVRWVLESSTPPNGRYRYLTAALAAEPLRPGVRIRDEDPVVYLLDGSPACARSLVMALGLPGTVVLLETDLTRAWNAAVEGGLVSSTRVEVEQRLRTLELPGTAHVAALLAASDAVLVPTRTDMSVLQRLAQRIDVRVPITTVRLPVPRLPFPELLPPRDQPFIVLPEVDAAGFNPEYVADQRLSRAATAVIPSPDPVTALRALAHGTVPVLPAGRDVGIPSPPAAQGPDNQQSLRELAVDLAADPEKLHALALMGFEHVANRHSSRRFAHLLLEALPGTEPQTEATK